MKIIRTKLVRLTGCKYITTPWAIFAAPKANIFSNDMRHEAIHQAQQRELILVFFLIWYATEWLLRALKHTLEWAFTNKKFSWHEVYRSISFEREAYRNDKNQNYLKSRKSFAFLNQMKH